MGNSNSSDIAFLTPSYNAIAFTPEEGDTLYTVKGKMAHFSKLSQNCISFWYQKKPLDDRFPLSELLTVVESYVVAVEKYDKVTVNINNEETKIVEPSSIRDLANGRNIFFCNCKLSETEDFSRFGNLDILDVNTVTLRFSIGIKNAELEFAEGYSLADVKLALARFLDQSLCEIALDDVKTDSVNVVELYRYKPLKILSEGTCYATQKPVLDIEKMYRWSYLSIRRLEGFIPSSHSLVFSPCEFALPDVISTLSPTEVTKAIYGIACALDFLAKKSFGFAQSISPHLVLFDSKKEVKLDIQECSFGIDVAQEVGYFGILLYKILTRDLIGEPDEQLEAVPASYREMIRRCCLPDKAKRPTFTVLIQRLKKECYYLEGCMNHEITGYHRRIAEKL